MRIHWFSPLPPAPTEIANHTARLLPALAARTELVVWTHQESWDPGLDARFDVRRFTRGDLERGTLFREWNGEQDVCVYNLGNNIENHDRIFLASRLHPGLVVAHDTALLQFATGFALVTEGRPLDEFLDTIELEYGPELRRDVQRFAEGRIHVYDVVERAPCTRLCLRGAQGLVVHGATTSEVRAEMRRRPFRRLELPYVPQRVPRAFPGTAPRTLLVFGFIAANRRLPAILRAFAAFPRREHYRIEVAGHLYEEEQVRALIRELGLEPLVRLRGFLPEPELQEALDRASLVLNLRHPTAGEASAAALRIWEHARPSLVTPVGWYADEPAELFGFVRPECEQADLTAHFERLLDDPDSYREQGLRGRRRLESGYDPAVYAAELLELADEARRFRASACAESLVQRVGLELGTWCPEGPARLLARSTAQRIAQTFVDEAYRGV